MNDSRRIGVAQRPHGSPSLPANLNRRAASNVLIYRWGESIPPNAGTGHAAAAHCRRVVINCPHRHSANRRRVYEDTHVDLGWGSARARLDGVVGKRPATRRRRTRAAAERHADREAGGVSRLRRALRAGIRLDLRPVWPLLVPPLLSGQKITAPIGCEAALEAASLFMAKRLNSPAGR